MGGGQSKPDPVPTALSIYVTNKTQGVEHLFVRVRGDKLREHETYSRISSETSVGITSGGNAGAGGKKGASAGATVGLEISHRHEEEKRKRQLFDCLTQGGFSLLPLNEPKPFALENLTTAYISVYVPDGDMIWNTDMPVSPQTYCCVTVKGDQENGISVQPSNPKPRWIKVSDNDVDKSLISRGLVEVFSRQSPNNSVFLARARLNIKGIVVLPSGLGTILVGVRIERGKVQHVLPDLPTGFKWEVSPDTTELLANPGHEWVKVLRGNTIPPNAVKTDSVRYVGRINDDTVCDITEVNGMIDYFVSKGSKTTSGEILLLTSDPDIPPGQPAKLLGEKHKEVNKEEIEQPLGNPQEMEEDENEIEEDENENEMEEDENEMKGVVNENSIMSHFRAALGFMKKRKRKISLLLLFVSTSVIALTLTRRLVFGRSARSPSPASWANLAGLHLAVFSKEQMN